MGIGAVAIRRHNKAIYGLLILFLVLNICGCKKREVSIKSGSTISNFECPVPPGAFKVFVSTKNPPGTKAISYTIRMERPARQIIDFYDSKFKPPQWIPFAEDGFGDRKWAEYIDGTMPGSPKINSFVASWVDSKKEVRLVLALIYRSTAGKDELGVTCQIYPFYDLRLVEEAEKKGTK